MSDQNRQRPEFVVNQSGLRPEFSRGEPCVVLARSDHGPALVGVVCQGSGLFRSGEFLISAPLKLGK